MPESAVVNKTGPKTYKFAKVLPWILVIAGVVGTICAAALVYDHSKIAANPNYIPSCNLNPVIACGDVIKSKQAHLFVVPNPYIGLVAFPMVLTTGVAMLAGAKFKRWYWLLFWAGTIFGLGFVHWLFYETVYRIHALCPYCMGVWLVTIPTFWYVTLYLIQAGHIKLPAKLQSTGRFLVRHHVDVIVLWFIVLVALILKHFWYYYGHYF